MDDYVSFTSSVAQNFPPRKETSPAVAGSVVAAAGGFVYSGTSMGESKLQPGAMTMLCVGAHPDDCEFQCSGAAAKWAARGDRIVYLSMTDGRSGHHLLDPDAVAERRRKEAGRAAALIGAESRNLGVPDGALEANLQNRLALIGLIRDVKPDVIVTNRPNDYHPDHRYASILVQDSAYMLMVPHVAPETPPLEYNPIVLYWVDHFTFPREIRADVAIGIDEVFETKLEMLAAHESQMFEWLPWIERYPDPPPAVDRPRERREWLRAFYGSRYRPSTAERFRKQLVGRYGAEAGGRVAQAEVFEVCEYGTQPSSEELERIFEGL